MPATFRIGLPGFVPPLTLALVRIGGDVPAASYNLTHTNGVYEASLSLVGRYSLRVNSATDLIVYGYVDLINNVICEPVGTLADFEPRDANLTEILGDDSFVPNLISALEEGVLSSIAKLATEDQANTLLNRITGIIRTSANDVLAETAQTAATRAGLATAVNVTDAQAAILARIPTALVGGKMDSVATVDEQLIVDAIMAAASITPLPANVVQVAGEAALATATVNFDNITPTASDETQAI
jgi:hypothetical protein